ncbi:hypothetical protein M378DRAFT_172370 [Amanita muscaria Koide BX008]|uniref:Uncharacterized protein n=1 Tax=Amanita muscaria (strain Koide BX008) TaxID=946122 RepID=A0A0C2S2E4_AMAMK|nr:hypothetical protein M378DRAFT_172370 [Amanita muscaria Koide BX008]
MTTSIPRLVRARSIIGLIRWNIKDCKLTEHSFANATIGSDLSQYMCREAILWEFSGIAKNLKFPSNDPIYTVHPEFRKAASQLYNMHNIIVDKDDVHGPMTEVDYNKVWSMITGFEELYPMIDFLIKAEQTKEKEKKKRDSEDGRAYGEVNLKRSPVA